MDLDAYDGLIHRIYDAALQPERWQGVLADVARHCGASRSLLYTPHHTPDRGGFLFPFNISQSDIDMWSAWGHLEDPLVRVATQRGLIANGEGLAMQGEELLPISELVASEFYRRLWEPMDVARVVSGMVFDGTDARKLPTILAVYRPLRAPAFTPVEVTFIQRLLAHVSRSLGVMFHLRDGQLRLASSLAALDRLPASIFLVSATTDVQFANEAARELLLRADPLVLQTPQDPSTGIGRLKLAPRLSGSAREFRRCIDEAVSSLNEREPPHFSGAVVLPDEAGGPAFVINASALGSAPFLAMGGNQPRGILILHDLAAAATVSPDRLIAAFGFTAAEAGAAIEVLRCGSVAEMASRLGVSLNTVKTQMKAVYAKSNTHRHADLLKMLLALSSPL